MINHVELYRQHSSNLGGRTSENGLKLTDSMCCLPSIGIIDLAEEQAKSIDLPVVFQTKEIIKNFVTIMITTKEERLRLIPQHISDCFSPLWLLFDSESLQYRGVPRLMSENEFIKRRPKQTLKLLPRISTGYLCRFEA